MKKISISLLTFLIVSMGLMISPSLAAQKNLSVAVILWRGETVAEKGFQDRLAELGYSIKYSKFDAAQKKDKLLTILKDQIEPGIKSFNYIYTFGTTTSLAAKSFLKGRKPQIFNIVAGPVEAGLVNSWQSSGGNLCGVSNSVPVDIQIKAALKLFSFKKLVVFHNPKEKNSSIFLNRIKKASKTYNFNVYDLPATPNSDELESNLEKLSAGSIDVDAVYLPPDSYLASKAELIGDHLKEAKIKTIGSIGDYIKAGALMGTVPDYYQLGASAAEIIDMNLKGKKLSEIPIRSSSKPKIIINKKTSELLGISIPENIVEKAVMVE